MKMWMNLILYGISCGMKIVRCFSVVGIRSKLNHRQSISRRRLYDNCILLRSRNACASNVFAAASKTRLPTSLAAVSSWTTRSYHSLVFWGRGTSTDLENGLLRIPFVGDNKHSRSTRFSRNGDRQLRLWCSTVGITTTTISSDEAPDHIRRSMVHTVIAESIQKLQQTGIDEAEETVFQMMAFVLKLSWDSGFRDLRNDYVLLHATTGRQRRPMDGTTGDGSGRTDLMHRTLSKTQVHQWQGFLERRLNHEPLQYILGQWDFLDYTLQILPPLLCPRPETEELVLLARRSLTAMRNAQVKKAELMTEVDEGGRLVDGLRVLDVGCGTGCIGIALCASHPTVHVTALDVDSTAVSVANENAQRILGTSADEQKRRFVALRCAVADYDPLSGQQQQQEQDGVDENFATSLSSLLFDMVVSNPPYIPPAEMTTLDSTVKDYESHVALCGGSDPDGMHVIRQIVRRLPHLCKAGASCWMEVHPTHPALLQEWLSTTAATGMATTGQAAASTSFAVEDGDATAAPEGVEFVQTIQDFQGKDRYVELRVNSTPF